MSNFGFTPLAAAALIAFPCLASAPAAIAQIAARARAGGVVADAITDLSIENTGSGAQTSVPITFGQAFAPGDLLPADTIVGKAASGLSLPFQVDIKARHADGSVRHAILSAVLPSLPAGRPEVIGLVKSTAAAAPAATATPAALLEAGFDANVSVALNGETYTASAATSLKSGAYTTWLAGPVANEWLVSAPLVSARGVVHPHLQVRYAIRAYSGLRQAKVDVILENDWAFQAAPQNFTYDVKVNIDGKEVYAKSALTHYHHARWRKSFWWGAAPQVNLRENSAYLMAAKAVPNYDRSVVVSDAQLRTLAGAWSGSKTEPMGAGLAMPSMGTTGGRPDIGLIPGWAVAYLLSMDRRARDVTLGTADLAGSWSIHYRDRKTDRPVSIANYPYMTILGEPSDTINPHTRKSEAFPACVNCSNPNEADSAHEPAFNYLPYLLTGDFYQLEELQFWAMWNAFKTNPGYRGNVQGLVHQSQVRDQAWSMRNLADAAYITPDRDPLKPQLLKIVANNLAWYNAQYSNNPRANGLGINIDGGIEYNGDLGIAPWMDDFFTSAIGRIAEQDFAGARPLLLYKAKFPVSRMTDPGFCWIFGASYSINVRTAPAAALFTSIGQAYASTLASNFPALGKENLAVLPCGGWAMSTALKLRVGEMTGYSENPTGFPANMQPALAYSVDAGAPGAADAWRIFGTRSVKPNYANGPQFAIVPREARGADAAHAGAAHSDIRKIGRAE